MPNFLFIIVPIFILVTFIFVILMIMSPKFRGKMMGKQIQATKYMIDENEEALKSIANKTAGAHKDAIETTVRAVKHGLTREEQIYCKHCGFKIDPDSTFCKSCGKKQ